LDHSNLDKKSPTLELHQRISMDLNSSMTCYDSWQNWRTLQDNAEWMENIFEDALQDPLADWNTGNANIPCVLPFPSASKGPKRKSECDIDGRKPKKERPTWNLCRDDVE